MKQKGFEDNAQGVGSKIWCGEYDLGVKDITIGVMIIVKDVVINALDIMIIAMGVIIIAMGVIIITMGVMIISYAQYFFNFNINISFLIFIT